MNEGWKGGHRVGEGKHTTAKKDQRKKCYFSLRDKP